MVFYSLRSKSSTYTSSSQLISESPLCSKSIYFDIILLSIEAFELFTEAFTFLTGDTGSLLILEMGGL